MRRRRLQGLHSQDAHDSARGHQREIGTEFQQEVELARTPSASQHLARVLQQAVIDDDLFDHVIVL